MKVFSVTGMTGSGKTTTIENIVKELIKRGYSVGTVKEIHNEAFKMDTEGKNTYRHRAAGAKTVTALGFYETDVMYPYKMNIYELLRHYREDYVILEGVDYAVVPRIITAKNHEELVVDDLTFMISGVIANDVKGRINDITVLSGIDEIKEIVDLIEAKVPTLMFDIERECCGHCGMTCRELLSGYLKGKNDLSECALSKNKVKLTVDGNEIETVPFVDDILYNAVTGVAKELRGYKDCRKIEIHLKS